MNLLTSHASSLFHGVVDVVKDGEGLWVARRMTARQLEYFTPNQMWDYRTRCMAGVQLVLRTDAAHLTLAAVVETGARPYFSLTVEVDGAVREEILCQTLPDGPIRWQINLGESTGGRDIRIHLCHYRPMRFSAVELPDGASFSPVAPTGKKLLCLGDSITQGMTSYKPYTTYAMTLARLLGMQLLNQGVGGHRVDAASFDTALPYEPDLITVAYGTNDWTSGKSLELIRDEAKDYAALLRRWRPDAKMVWVTPLWRSDQMTARAAGVLPEFSAALTEGAAAGGASVIHGATLLPHHGDYYFDGLHPNDLGGVLYGANLYREILRLFPAFCGTN